MAKLTATYLYSGLPDYWRGDGERWEDNNGCLFAYYSTTTTLRDIIDELVADFNAGGDCDSMHEDITGEDVREALLAMLNDAGRRDYESGALAECAVEFAACNGLEPGVDLDDQVSDEDRFMYDELPFLVVLLKSETCTDCGAWAEQVVNHVCETCAKADGFTDEMLYGQTGAGRRI